MTKYLKDILDQPDQLLQSLDYSLSAGSAQLKNAAALVRKSKYVFISAIGASWNAGIAIQVALNNIGVQAVLCDAADFLHLTRIPAESVVIFLSRSGKSIEVVNALPKCKSANASIICITNSPESDLAIGSDVNLLTNVRFDNSISVSTYTSIILTGLLLAQEIGSGLNHSPGISAMVESIQNVRSILPEWKELIDSIEWANNTHPTYFTARGSSLASAHESMLLWEEGAKQPASALTTGAFRHGPQEIIKNKLNMAVWIENETARQHDIALINDLVEKEINVLSLGYSLPPQLKGYKIDLPYTSPLFSPVINIIPLQIASEKLARIKGVDPDGFYYCNFIVETEGGL